MLVALGRIGTPEVVGALVRFANDERRWVRVSSLHALAEMRAPEGRNVARTKLTDPSWAVRGAAALALGRLGRRTDAPELLPLLVDGHPWVRRGALYALGQIGARKALPRIRRALDDPDPEVRVAAIWVTGHLRDRVALPRLIRQLGLTGRETPVERRTLGVGDGAVRLISDAESTMFDALVQAVGEFAAAEESARSAVASARSRVTEGDLLGPARLPSPSGASRTLSLRQLFDGPPRAPADG